MPGLNAVREFWDRNGSGVDFYAHRFMDLLVFILIGNHVATVIGVHTLRGTEVDEQIVNRIPTG